MEKKYIDKLLDEINEAKSREKGLNDFRDLLIKDEESSRKKHGSAFLNLDSEVYFDEVEFLRQSVQDSNRIPTYKEPLPRTRESYQSHRSIYPSREDIYLSQGERYSSNQDYVTENDNILSGNPYLESSAYNRKELPFTLPSKGRQRTFKEKISFTWKTIKVVALAVFIVALAIFIYLIRQGYTLDKIQSIVTIERSKDKLDPQLISLAKRNVDAIPFVMDKLQRPEERARKETIDEFIKDFKKQKSKTDYPYMSAYNLLWSDYDFAGKYLALNGSGPLCLSSILFKHELYLFNPVFIAEFLQQRTVLDGEIQMSKDGLLAFAEQFSLSVKEIEKSEETIRAYLAEGNDILCLINIKNSVSRSKENKHYVIINAINANGDISIIDFQDKKLSEGKFKFSEIVDKLIAIYAITV